MRYSHIPQANGREEMAAKDGDYFFFSLSYEIAILRQNPASCHLSAGIRESILSVGKSIFPTHGKLGQSFFPLSFCCSERTIEVAARSHSAEHGLVPIRFLATERKFQKKFINDG